MLIEKLKARLGAAIVAAENARGEESIVIGRDSVPDVMRRLRDEADFAFDFMADLTAVDWLTRTPRFDVVYQLRSLSLGTALRVKVGIDGAEPWTHSVAGLWKAADWFERECYDMFGIRFEGHPDLRRILMYDSFEGHPLRKDYPYNRRQVLVEEVDPVTHPRRPSR